MAPGSHSTANLTHATDSASLLPPVAARPATSLDNSVYHSLTSVLEFADQDQLFWWTETASIVAKLMESAGYDVESQRRYLLLYHAHILAALGPKQTPCPSDRSASSPWKSFMTDDHTPIEISWNLGANRSVVRLSIEPIGPFAGTSFDPFNQRPALELLQQLPGIDLQLFYYFRDWFFIDDDDVDDVLKRRPAGEHSSQLFVAFDFDGGKVTTKAYIFPLLKALETGIPVLDLVSTAIRNLDEPALSVSPGWNVLEDFIRSCPIASRPKLEFIAIDCVAPEKSRIKIYVRTPHTALEKVKDVFTLGGRLNDQTIQTALGMLEELWRLVLDLPDGLRDSDELHPRDENSAGHRTSGVLFNFEIKPGAALPEPKLYIPVRHYARSDLDIARGLTAFFRRRGWTSLAETYTDTLKETL